MSLRTDSRTASPARPRPAPALLFATLTAVALAAAAVGREAEADPQAEYPIVPEAGNWLICAASFSGPEAPRNATALVNEVRQKYHLAAYVFNRGAKERKEQQEHVEQMRKLLNQNPGDPHVPIRTTRIEEQCAVLVGGFKDMEAARKALDGFKKLKPPDSVPKDTLFWTNPAKNADRAAKPDTGWVNPFQTSFVVHNPTVAMEKENAKHDPFLKQLNAYETYSLLNCRKPWTLAVANFQGVNDFQEKTVAGRVVDTLLMRDKPETLSGCAMTAHSLAEALRAMKYDAYVLHTRYTSVVTVGGFDSQEDPKMRAVAESIVNHVKLPGDPTSPNAGAVKGGTTAPPCPGILKQPLPMEVPRP